MFADGFDPTMVARVLCERGMLRRGQRQFTNTVRIEGEPRRVYVLTTDIVDEHEVALSGPSSTSDPTSDPASGPTDPASGECDG